MYKCELFVNFQKEKRLSKNLQKVKREEVYESQFTGIFRRRKYVSASNSTRPSFAKPFAKESHDLAKERAELMRKKKISEIKHKNHEKEDKFNANMLKMMQIENKYESVDFQIEQIFRH